MDRYKKERIRNRLLATGAVLLFLGTVVCHYLFAPWGFYRAVSPEEAALRQQVVQTAAGWLGKNEADGSHMEIIGLYNAHEPLAVGYVVQETDSWCAAFVSTVAIQCGITEILPTECGCERQIGLFQELGRWEESDKAVPQPGDLIYYDWNMEKHGECTGWADHVGIVTGVKWPFIQVIEGNYEDRVGCRVILVDDIQIRGFGKPDYASIVNSKTP